MLVMLAEHPDVPDAFLYHAYRGLPASSDAGPSRQFWSRNLVCRRG
jgi:hypothetical protein